MTDADTPTEEAVSEEQPPKKQHGKLYGWRLTIAAAVFLVIVLANVFIELPYYVESPGDTIPVNRYLNVAPDHEFAPKGEFLLTTVSLLRAHPFDIVWAWLTPGTKIEKKKEILGTATPQQFTQESAQEMNGSQLAAVYVAMQRAGKNVTLLGDGATVRAVQNGSPAAGKINVNDTIVGVDKKKVQLASDVGNVVRTHKPGETVSVDVLDDKGAFRTVSIVTAGSQANSAVPYIGVSVETKNLHLDTPFSVTFKSTDIGGPSAGLAFTLALTDELTPGELTGGGKVAATGTMDGDGSVGEIGGIEQKTRSVKKAGVSLFIVPNANAAEAKKYAGKMKIVGVDNLEQAIDALKANGGDVSGLPTGITIKPAA